MFSLFQEKKKEKQDHLNRALSLLPNWTLGAVLRWQIESSGSSSGWIYVIPTLNGDVNPACPALIVSEKPAETYSEEALSEYKKTISVREAVYAKFKAQSNNDGVNYISDLTEKINQVLKSQEAVES